MPVAAAAAAAASAAAAAAAGQGWLAGGGGSCRPTSRCCEGGCLRARETIFSCTVVFIVCTLKLTLLK